MRLTSHPFVTTPNKGKCSSCGRKKSDSIHILVFPKEETMVTSVDRIMAAFDIFCKKGKVVKISDEDFGYIQHAFRKAALHMSPVTGTSHQLFALMALKADDPEKVQQFLLEVARKRVSQ